MSEKVIGYTLLVSGLALMAVFSFNAYQVFTKKTPPIQYFKLSSVSLDTAAFVPDQLKSQIQKPQNMEILSGQTLSDMSNLTIHLVLMSFLVSVGFKVSTLGIQMLRTIEVKLNAK